MKNWKTLTVLALLVGALVASSALPILADDDGEKKEGTRAEVVKKEEARAAMAKKIAGLLKKVKISLSDACTKAEGATKGKAVAAKIEADGDEVTYEVVVVVVAGEKVTLREVDIDAVSGKVLEDEEVDDEDGEADEDDDEDDEDDDDDEDDEDDDDDDDEKK